jgi:hypothetical protein
VTTGRQINSRVLVHRSSNRPGTSVLTTVKTERPFSLREKDRMRENIKAFSVKYPLSLTLSLGEREQEGNNDE